MTKLFPALAALALIVSMSSCSQDEVLSQNDGLTPLKLRVTTGKTTRAVQSEINYVENLGTITVYVRNASDGTATYLIAGDGSLISEFTMECTTVDGNFVSATTDPAVIYLPSDASIKLVAFAGETVPPFGFDGTNVTIDDFTSNAKASELVYAVSDLIESDTTTATLAFNHIVSQLIFAAAGNETNGLDIIINSLSVTNIPVSGNFDDSRTSADGFGFFDSSTFGFDSYSTDDDTMDVVTDNMSSIYVATLPITERKEFASCYVLPCNTGDLGDNATIEIDYDIVIYDNQASATRTLVDDATMVFKFNTPLTPQPNETWRTWDVAKRNLYTFKPGDAQILNLIMSVSVSSWEDDYSTDIEAAAI